MTLLDRLRQYLIDEGVVRSPRTAGSEPPMWLEPKLGAPAPGEGENPTEVGPTITVSAFLGGGIPARPYEAFWRRQTVDLWLRTRTAPQAFDIDSSIYAAIADRRNWGMAGLLVIESRQWRELQRLGSDEQGFTFIASYLFETYAP